jgi:hypothetical protein
MSKSIDTEGFGLGEDTNPFILAALYNNASVTNTAICMFIAVGNNKPKLSIEDARTILKEQGNYVDYLYGKCIKINFNYHPLEVRLYDRDHGQGAAENAILKAIDELL